jgi:beta-N-acetylhexosaminidase
VVLVCHPQMVEDALRALEGRKSNTMALAGLIGRGALGWDGLLADARYEQAQSRMGTVPIATQDAGATSGAINVGDVA